MSEVKIPDYSGITEEASEDSLKRIARLVMEQVAAELAVIEAEKALKQAQSNLLVISESLLPAAMEEAGMVNLTVAGGIEVVVDEHVRASIPKKFEEQAFAWLEENGHEKMIKHQITTIFGKEDHAWAKKFLADCAKRKKKLHMKRKDYVEPMTLKAFVKAQLKEGVDLPLELFGANVIPYTKLKLPNNETMFDSLKLDESGNDGDDE